MKVMIIEDEKLSAEHLIHLLEKIRADIEIIKCSDSVAESVTFLKQNPELDLIFMDIHLADGISFEIFVDTNIETPVVFTTAYDDYAIRAFKVNSLDYLLKPIGIHELQETLNKYEKYHRQEQQGSDAKIKEVLQHLTRNYKSRFMVRVGQNIESIPVEDIMAFMTRESLSFLLRNDGKKFPVDYTLDQLENLLSPLTFFRINRKTLVHIQSIKKISPYLNGRLSLQIPQLDGDFAIVSRERVNDFKRWLDQ